MNAAILYTTIFWIAGLHLRQRSVASRDKSNDLMNMIGEEPGVDGVTVANGYSFMTGAAASNGALLSPFQEVNHTLKLPWPPEARNTKRVNPVPFPMRQPDKRSTNALSFQPKRRTMANCRGNCQAEMQSGEQSDEQNQPDMQAQSQNQQDENKT